LVAFRDGDWLEVDDDKGEPKLDVEGLLPATGVDDSIPPDPPLGEGDNVSGPPPACPVSDELDANDPPPDCGLSPNGSLAKGSSKALKKLTSKTLCRKSTGGLEAAMKGGWYALGS
jgi:hypothetical protein